MRAYHLYKTVCVVACASSVYKQRAAPRPPQRALRQGVSGGSPRPQGPGAESCGRHAQTGRGQPGAPHLQCSAAHGRRQQSRPRVRVRSFGGPFPPERCASAGTRPEASRAAHTAAPALLRQRGCRPPHPPNAPGLESPSAGLPSLPLPARARPKPALDALSARHPPPPRPPGPCGWHPTSPSSGAWVRAGPWRAQTTIGCSCGDGAHERV